MHFTKKTPRVDRVIQGVILSFPVIYAAGPKESLTEGEANTLNQTLWENLRNNFAEDVAEAKEKSTAEGHEVDLASLQEQFDQYARAYEFGVRVGGTRVGDPITAEAMDLARGKIRERLREMGQLKGRSSAEITELARQQIEKNPAFMARAKEIVAARQASATELGVDLS